MTYDQWKTRSPDDELDRNRPDDDEPEKSNGKQQDVGAENIEQAMALCSRALVDVFEECAKRYENAIEAENRLHEHVVQTLTRNAASCREQGKQSSQWLQSRATTAGLVVTNAAASLQALTPHE